MAFSSSLKKLVSFLFFGDLEEQPVRVTMVMYGFLFEYSKLADRVSRLGIKDLKWANVTRKSMVVISSQLIFIPLVGYTDELFRSYNDHSFD